LENALPAVRRAETKRPCESPLPKSIFLPPFFCHQIPLLTSSLSTPSIPPNRFFRPFRAQSKKKPQKTACKSHHYMGHCSASVRSLTYRQTPAARPPRQRPQRIQVSYGVFPVNVKVKPGQPWSSLVKVRLPRHLVAPRLFFRPFLARPVPRPTDPKNPQKCQ